MSDPEGVLSEIANRLRAAPPSLAPPVQSLRNQAGVGIVLHACSQGIDLLLIERARREGDHWSGDVAFPGGRREAQDADVEGTARREVFEETGIVLPPPIARLDDFDSRKHRRNFEIVVSPFVYTLLDQAAKPELRLSEEVATALWVPLVRLWSPDARATFERRIGDATMRVSALRIDDHVIWGMTYRMLADFARRIGMDLPD